MKHQLSGIIGQKETAVIAAVVDEITAKPIDQLGLKLLPIVSRPEVLVYHEKVSGHGGVLAERLIGAPGPTTPASSSQVFEFSMGAYQESKEFGEKQLIALRKLGSIGARGVTGLTAGALDWMSRAGENLKVKLTNRLNKLAWDTIFTGVYTYMGVTKYDFNVPAGNTIQAATDWSDNTNSTPFSDLFAILTTNPLYMKYIIDYVVINPITAAAMLMSKEARTLVSNNAQAVGDINKVAQILYPGMPEIRICRDAWQDETTTNGLITHGNAQFFVPNWKVLAVPNMGGTLYPEFGEIQVGLNMNDPQATPESPAMGIYTFVDEEGLKKRKAPFVEVTTGFNGGPNLMRGNDVLVIKVKAGV